MSAKRWTLVLAAALALSGCGIRPTEVPVDAGEAPSRAACRAQDKQTPAAPRGEGEELREVFLVCGSEIASVLRSVPATEAASAAERRKAAGVLLDELKADPPEREKDDGYLTKVSDLDLAPAVKGDPPMTVRLSTDPDDLEELERAQVACTLAALEVSFSGSSKAVLGGPSAAQPQSYECTEAVRLDPGALQAEPLS